MTIDQQLLIKELQSMEAQRATQLEALHRIDGALAMCRHLLAKGAAPQPAEANVNGAAEAEAKPAD